MDDESSGFGFGRNGNNNKKNMYAEQFVCVWQPGNSVHGILERVDVNERCAYFNPYVVAKADGFLRIMQGGLPTKMDFPLTIIMPMPGTIEEYVEAYNQELKRKKEKKDKRKK